jgi:hypothetical protein
MVFVLIFLGRIRIRMVIFDVFYIAVRITITVVRVSAIVIRADVILITYLAFMQAF